MLNVLVLLDVGGHQKVKIEPHMLGDLAESIADKGYEYLVLSKSEPIKVVGFMVTGSQTGERLIVLGGESQ